MSIYRTSVTVSFFVFIFILQSALINQIPFFVGGFSLFLAVTFSWIASTDRAETFAAAFIAGILLDLSPSLDSPVGLWTFSLLLLSYLISLYRESLGDLDERPLTAALYLVATTSLSILLYLLIAALLGVDVPPALTATIDTAGNAIWTLLLSPIYFPLINRLKVRLFAIRSGV
jgi:rod shape-determining protein MreD